MKIFWKKKDVLLPILAILAVEAVLFIANYTPGTWLIGWDSTQPELNLSLALGRLLSPVWQEYRGLGVLDGMAHAANILHWFYIFVLGLFLKVNVVRYVFIFLMHLL